MRTPSSLLKWVANLFQNCAVGLFMLGVGTLLFQDVASGANPEVYGSVFMVLSWVFLVASGLVEVWLVIRDKGK